MTVLSDATLRELGPSMIFPFTAEQVRRDAGVRKISYGTSSYGYDVRLAKQISLFTNKHGRIIDPKDFDLRCLEPAQTEWSLDGDYVLLPPHSYLLGHTVEEFKIPNDIMVIAVGKSTYARCGIHVNVTPIEPGFEGQIVIEISNATSLPAKIYLEEGIAQFVFLRGDRACSTSYADRRGKYQGQQGVAHAKV